MSISRECTLNLLIGIEQDAFQALPVCRRRPAAHVKHAVPAPKHDVGDLGEF